MGTAWACLPILPDRIWLQRGTGGAVTMIWQKCSLLCLKLFLLSKLRCTGWAIIVKEGQERCWDLIIPYCTASVYCQCARLLSGIGSALSFWLHVLQFPLLLLFLCFMLHPFPFIFPFLHFHIESLNTI